MPVLDRYEQIRDELRLYRAAGGGSILDCQPGGCGRNAARLAQLAEATGVHIIACTGFHRQKYYAPGHRLFSADARQAGELFLSELGSALAESQGQPRRIRAGFIKIALESAWDESPQALLEAAADAARQSKALVEIHTEKGGLAEKAIIFFEERGVSSKQLVLCHMDKRPDPCLHMELAKYGALLEYDTFYRPKSEPEARLWPLICKMVEAGLSDHLALATDMAEAAMYSTIGEGPGLASLPTEIKRRLRELGIPANSIRQMLGGNIARRLAGLD